jgi:hypothetical protein
LTGANTPCSAQVFPKQLLLAQLPPEVDILCTHPMFGPDSGRGSWSGLNFMYEVVRCGDDPRRKARVESFLKVGWAGLGWAGVEPKGSGGWGVCWVLCEQRLVDVKGTLRGGPRCMGTPISNYCC